MIQLCLLTETYLQEAVQAIRGNALGTGLLHVSHNNTVETLVMYEEESNFWMGTDVF